MRRWSRDRWIVPRALGLTAIERMRQPVMLSIGMGIESAELQQTFPCNSSSELCAKITFGRDRGGN